MSSKPSVWSSPLAWSRRKLRMKVGDVIAMMGYKPIQQIDFTHMTGQDFAHVIDVGVADGTPDLYARFPNAYLDLFEPHPHYQDHLEKTLLPRRPARLHRMGLGAQDGTAQLYLKGRTGSTMAADRGHGSIEVPVRRLDSVLSAADIRRPCLLKIDTEGYELEVLRGAEGLLPHIDCIVTEVSFATPTFTSQVIWSVIWSASGLGSSRCSTSMRGTAVSGARTSSSAGRSARALPLVRRRPSRQVDPIPWCGMLRAGPWKVDGS